MPKNKNIRATCLNCIDGRVQFPVLNWIRRTYNIRFIDVITSAGMDRLLASGEHSEEVFRSIRISVAVNNSTRVFVAAHHDCRGNPVSRKAHLSNLAKAIERLKIGWPTLDVVGLWVNSRWKVEAPNLDRYRSSC